MSKPVALPLLSNGAAKKVPLGRAFAAARRSARASYDIGAAVVSITEGAAAGAVTAGDPMPATDAASAGA